ncbi:MAG: aminoglycoside phosphotransferase family protein [Chloroflexi bacterium]|nr:aminoglycoside phosphotransferase family protein [Chloroflexota bacterium]
MSRVRYQLRETGFADAASYWPYPPRMPSRCWLPLDSPAAIERWRRQQRPGLQTDGIAGLPRRLALGLALRAGLRTGTAVPICALARKPLRREAGPVDLAGIQDGPIDPNELLRDRWESWGFGPTPDRFAWLLATGGRHSSNKVVGLVSAASDGVPRLVVKMPRVAGSLASLENEAAALASVHAQRPGGMPGVPRLLFCDIHDGFGRLGETYAEGEPLFRRLNEGNYRDYAIKATDWLVALAGRPDRRVSKTWLDRQIEQRFAVFHNAAGQAIDGLVLQETRETLNAAEGLPVVGEHRDFSPWNVHIGPDGSLAVLDWESAQMEGLPALDLVYFLAYLAFFRDGAMETGGYLESYRASLNPSTFTGGVRAECLARYANAVGIDPATLGPLGLFAWLIHAGTTQTRLSTGGKLAPAAAGNPFVTLWQEDLRRYQGNTAP